MHKLARITLVCAALALAPRPAHSQAVPTDPTGGGGGGGAPMRTSGGSYTPATHAPFARGFFGRPMLIRFPGLAWAYLMVPSRESSIARSR